VKQRRKRGVARAKSTPPRKTEVHRDQQQRANKPSSWAIAGAFAASAVFGGAASPAFAQDGAQPPADGRLATHRFSIPGGRLDTALVAFGRTTGLTITDPTGLVGETLTHGVSGVLTAEDALQRLLAGTGVAFRFTTGRSVRLERGSLATQKLSTVAIVGAREQASLSSAKYTEPLRDVPQTVTVVPQHVLASQGVTTLRDAVRNVPGLTVNAGEGGATPGDNFNVRGFSARGDIFVDGVRDIGGYARETFNIEQVEVTKGPGSAYTGRGSTGGAVNLVTKSPHLGTAYSAVLGAGNADYHRATVDLNQPLDSLGLRHAAFRINGMWGESGVADLPVVEKKSWGVAPSLAFGLGTATQVTIDFFTSKQNNIPAYGLQSNTTNGPPTNIDVHQYFGLTDLDFEHIDAEQATAKVIHDVRGGLTLRNTLAWGHTDAQRVVTYARADGTRNSPSHITDDANLTNQTNLQASFHTGRIEHATVAGVEAAHEKSLFASYHFSKAPPKVTDLNHANPDDAYTGVVTEGLPRRSASSNSIAGYAFETMKLSSHWELSGGLRYDYFSPTYRDSLARDITPDTASSHALTGRVGVVFKPTARGSIYAAYGTSFNPSGELLSFDSRGASGVKPEKNRTYEIGTKWDLLAERLAATAAVFRTDKTNARMTNPEDPSGPQILAGFQRVKGVELGASGRFTDDWTIFAGWTWLDGEIIKGSAGLDHTPIVNTPKHSANLWTTYTLPWDLEIGTGMRFVDKRYWAATSTVPSYTAWDASASYPATKRIDLQLNLTNLTDATYFETGRYWVPAAGRSIRFSTILKY
jgi:catecholate siderophore receptor